MALCGHQFHGGDESDWILSTSASSWDGSTTAGRILQELFKKNRRSIPSKIRKKKLKSVVVPFEKMSISKLNTNVENDLSSSKESKNLIVKKITGFCNFENFDETQHLNGCPVKWLYNRRMLDKNKFYKMERLCNIKSGKKEETKRKECKGLRDKTPIEVKIHKINLIEKYTSNCDGIQPPCPTVTSEKSEKDLKAFENHRKKLAAKLNWKLHNETQDDDKFKISSELSSRHNYLPPRPLLGLKPLLSVLLAPHQVSECCSLTSLQSNLLKKKKTEASLSIQLLDLPFLPKESKLRPRTINTLRWGSKSSILSKKLQIPNQITIKLDQQQKKLAQNPENQCKTVCHNPPIKKFSERTKQMKSLSSLFYELKDKTNFRNQEYFKEMILDLTMNENRFKIMRFFNTGSANSDLIEEFKINPEKVKKLTEASSVDDSELNLVCEKVRFFKKELSAKAKQEEPLGSFH